LLILRAQLLALRRYYVFLFAEQSDERDSHKIHCMCADAMIRETGSVVFWCMHSVRTIVRARRSHVCCKLMAEVWEMIYKHVIKRGSKKQGMSNRRRIRGPLRTRGFE